MRWMALLALSAALTLSGTSSWRLVLGSQIADPKTRRHRKFCLASTRNGAGQLDSHGQRPPEIRQSSRGAQHCLSDVRGGRTGSLSGAMLENGQMDVSAFHLMLDGQDVTSKTNVRGTMDFPQSSGELFYKPDTPLSPGSHELGSFPDKKTGDIRHYTWGFEVKKATCNYKVNTRTSREHLYRQLEPSSRSRIEQGGRSWASSTSRASK